jgi:hypothetical protein
MSRRDLLNQPGQGCAGVGDHTVAASCSSGCGVEIHDKLDRRLIAFDALTLRALWSDDDTAGANFVKFVSPTIADGKVFRASCQGEVAPDGSTKGTVIVYGAKASQGSLPSLPVPTKRLVTALWDPGNHHLHLFTTAAAVMGGKPRVARRWSVTGNHPRQLSTQPTLCSSGVYA